MSRMNSAWKIVQPKAKPRMYSRTASAMPVMPRTLKAPHRPGCRRRRRRRASSIPASAATARPRNARAVPAEAPGSRGRKGRRRPHRYTRSATRSPTSSPGDSGVVRISITTNSNDTAASRNHSNITPSSIELSLAFRVSFCGETLPRREFISSSTAPEDGSGTALCAAIVSSLTSLRRARSRTSLARAGTDAWSGTWADGSESTVKSSRGSASDRELARRLLDHPNAGHAFGIGVFEAERRRWSWKPTLSRYRVSNVAMGRGCVQEEHVGRHLFDRKSALVPCAIHRRRMNCVAALRCLIITSQLRPCLAFTVVATCRHSSRSTGDDDAALWASAPTLVRDPPYSRTDCRT